MAEYIKQKIQGGKKSICDSCTHRNVCKVIDNQPCIECNQYQCTADVEPVQEWISVKDRLPEIGRSVIAYNAPAKCAAEAMYKGEGRFLQFRWSARLQEHEVTHWMPLPSTEGLK